MEESGGVLQLPIRPDDGGLTIALGPSLAQRRHHASAELFSELLAGFDEAREIGLIPACKRIGHHRCNRNLS